MFVIKVYHLASKQSRELDLRQLEFNEKLWQMTVEFVPVYGMEGSLGGSGMGRRFEILLTKPVQRDIIIVSFSKEGNV